MSDNIVFITGASSGIGRALADTVPFPARIIDLSRSGAEGVEHIAVDLATPQGWAEAGAAFERELGEHDPERAVLFHCAGTLTPIGFAGEVDGDEYADNLVLNAAAGPVIGHHFLRAAREHGVSCEIVMISSGAASSAYPGWSGYCAGKAALEHWVRTVGAEQQHRGGATVLAIAPGVVATAMQEQIRQQDAEDFPKVERFHELHDEGQLRDPAAVARELWAVLDRHPDTGSVLDLRDFPPDVS